MSSKIVKDPRNEIQQAALELLHEEGHSALSVRRIAVKAGCSTMGVYHWFGGKEGLVDALLIDGFKGFADALQKSRPKKTDRALPALMAQGRAYRTWALANPVYYRVMFLQAIPDCIPGVEAQLAGLVAYETLRSEIVREQKLGTIKEKDADVVALSVWGLVHGLVSIELTSAEPPSLSKNALLHNQAFEMALALVSRGLCVDAK
jgi:AcrR family transcriptional regulator